MLVIAALSACGATSTVVVTASATTVPPTATPEPSATILQVASTQHFADSKSGGTAAPRGNGDPLLDGDCGVTVTATCASGDVVLGGGWSLDDPLARVTSSFPASASAWTITAHDEGQDGGSHPVTVTAYAECLHANFAAGVNPVSSTPNIAPGGNPQAEHVDCPSGTVLTGGGVRGVEATVETTPTGNGWTAQLFVQQGSSNKPELFAVCAASHLASAGLVNATTQFQANNNADVSASCPSGTLLAGGGVNVDADTISSLAANSGMTKWQAHISNAGYYGGPPINYHATLTAICLSVS
jgi:hypothetical protein